MTEHQDHIQTAPSAASHAAPFSEPELAQLHASDLFAARAVVCLMVGIFCTGLVLYSIILVAITT